jgi:predicted phage-related endonuclease
MIERRPITDRAKWLEWRHEDVTASELGALFGVHPYMSALKLYLSKSGIEFPTDDNNPVFRRGRILEPAVAAAVAEARPNWRIEKAGAYYRDPDRRIGATPDFLVANGGLGCLQTKTAAPVVYERDWDSGRVVPFWVQLQTLTECMLTNAAWGAVAVLRVDPFDLECSIIEIPRHPAAEAKILAAVQQFWDDVEHAREPPADYGRDAELIRIIAPREIGGKTIDLSADNELPEMLQQRELICQQIDAFETRKSEIETAVKFKLRDAERATGLIDWSVTWKTVHRTEYKVPAKDVRTLRINRRRS